MRLSYFQRGRLLGLTCLPALAQRLLAADSIFLDSPRETLALESEPTFALFDRAFYHQRVFLLGESHGVERVQALDFALLRHLNQRAGVRHYLGELDAAQAHYLNAYLRTSDETPLRRVFAGWVSRQAVWGYADFAAKVRRIRVLNQTLPARRRIRFVGIDGVQDQALVADHLGELASAGQLLPLALAKGIGHI